MKTKTSFDKSVWFVTIPTTLLFIGLSIFSAYVLTTGNTSLGSPLLHSILLLAYFGILFFIFGSAPKSYQKTDDRIIIHRQLFGRTEILNSEIKKVRLLTEEETKKGRRNLGVGGLFGFFGYFRSPLLGNFRMFGSRWSNFVLIELLNGDKIVITPDNPAQFAMNS